MPSAPSRSQRQACWDARDAFFQCLESKDILDADGDVANKQCGKFKQPYHGNCAQSWVDYFNKRRILEKRQKLTLEKMDQDNKAKAAGLVAK